MRTVVPAGRARAFIIVYGGGFPTGDVRVTARFRNGRTYVQEIPNLSP